MEEQEIFVVKQEHITIRVTDPGDKNSGTIITIKQ